MQILPQTAEFLARRSGATTFTTADLGTPQVNIAYGSYYLRYLLDEYGGSRTLALAAYNGGEANVDRWLAQARANHRSFAARRHPLPGDAGLRPQGARRRAPLPADLPGSARGVAPDPGAAADTLEAVPRFELDAAYSPTADQPAAIAGLAEGVRAGERYQTLLGATGTGKTMTMAATIAAVQKPALVIAHNKTLAAQLCNEFRTYFPRNAVEYFVSYYDYYQPEAYVPSKDLYIEKDSAINQEIDRLRHSATAALFARRDVLIVASVSCIYGLGSPQTYDENLQTLRRGEDIDRDRLLRKLVSIQYTRNDTALARGTFRVRGDTLEIWPAYAETAYRIVLFGDEVEHLQHFDAVTGEILEDDLEHIGIWPASHYNVREGQIDDAVAEIGRELNERCTELEARGQAAGVPPAAPADAVRHGDAPRDGLLQRDRELQPDPRRPAAG